MNQTVLLWKHGYLVVSASAPGPRGWRGGAGISVVSLRNSLLTPYSTGPEVRKLFQLSAQLRLKFILLINVKMPTIVGILTFISRLKDIYGLNGSSP